MIRMSWASVVILAEAFGQAAGQTASVPLPAGLVPADARATPASVVCFLEGPAIDATGNILFSDIAGNRILKRSPAGEITVFRSDSGRTNGNTFDAQGRLISCEGAEHGSGGRRRIVRTDMKAGSITVLTERYQGKRYNSPNDVCVDNRGRVWFTDPRYGLDRSDLEMTDEAVYRIDADGTVSRVLTQPAVQKPNGIAITPDGRTLYVIDANPQANGNRKIWSFAVSAEGVPSGQKLVFDFGKGRGGDGMRLDVHGNLWVAAGINVSRGLAETLDNPAGVYVISPAGRLLGRIPIPEDLITNLAFGGPERKTLHVTAGKTLYQVPVNVAGNP
jgi:gluconolactonase